MADFRERPATDPFELEFDEQCIDVVVAARPGHNVVWRPWLKVRFSQATHFVYAAQINVGPPRVICDQGPSPSERRKLARLLRRFGIVLPQSPGTRPSSKSDGTELLGPRRYQTRRRGSKLGRH